MSPKAESRWSNVGLVLYVLVCGLPLLAGISRSLAYSFGLAGLLEEGFTTEYWLTLLRDREAMGTILYSLFMGLFSLVAGLIPALMLAWREWCRPVTSMRYFLIAPLAFPPLVAAFAWYHILSPSGLISRIANKLGWIEDMGQFPLLVNDYYGLGILVVHVFLVFPIFSLVFIAQAKKENLTSLHDVARSLGSNSRQFLFRIFIPVLLGKSDLLIRVYLVFLMGSYEVAMFLGRSSPRMFNLYITDKLGRFNLADIPVGHAMLVVYMLITAVIAFGGLKRRFRLI